MFALLPRELHYGGGGEAFTIQVKVRISIQSMKVIDLIDAFQKDLSV